MYSSFIRLLTFFTSFFFLHGCIMNSQYDQLPVGLIAQLVEHCTGRRRSKLELHSRMNVFQASFHNCLFTCVISCSYSVTRFTVATQQTFFTSYIISHKIQNDMFSIIHCCVTCLLDFARRHDH